MFKELKVTSEEEWLKLRSKVITATEMGVILGLNNYTSVTEMLEEKKSPSSLSHISHVVIGNILEPSVVKATNIALKDNFKLYENGNGKSFFVNDEIRLGATPDAYNKDTILECKSTKPVNHLKWYNWPPSYYLMQLYTQLICTDKNKGLISILSTNLTQRTQELDLPLLIFSLQRDKEIDNIIYKELQRYWDTVESGKKFRVNRKRVPELELRLRLHTTKIF